MIKRVMHRLRMMWIFAKQWPLCAEAVPDWQPEDASALANYLATPSGKKLLLTMRYNEQASNASAVVAKDRREYTCGWAAGQRGAFAWFYSLSTRGIESAPDDSSGYSAEELDERFSG